MRIKTSLYFEIVFLSISIAILQLIQTGVSLMWTINLTHSGRNIRIQLAERLAPARGPA